MHGGLFSSLFSAAKKRCASDILAKEETLFLQEILRKTVAILNDAARIARQYQNLAVRMVHESTILSPGTKRHFFRNLLYSDEESRREKFGENGGCKIQQWFLKAVFGTSKKLAKKINQNGHISQVNGADPFEGFSQEGHVSDIQRVLAAPPDDPYLLGLHTAFSESDEITGNIILAARRLWCQGYIGRWEEYPEFPSSHILTRLIEELARQLDQETAHNLTTNFLSYQQRYLVKQMEKLHAISDHIADKEAPELFAFLIDRLPLNERPDLIKLKDELAIESTPAFQQFIIQERHQLALMIGVEEIFEYDNLETVDDDNVDLRLALGFDDHKCIQTDFLFPAILSMGGKVEMPVTVIPNAGNHNRVLLFNSVATRHLMDNLMNSCRKVWNG